MKIIENPSMKASQSFDN